MEETPEEPEGILPLLEDNEFELGLEFKLVEELWDDRELTLFPEELLNVLFLELVLVLNDERVGYDMLVLGIGGSVKCCVSSWNWC